LVAVVAHTALPLVFFFGAPRHRSLNMNPPSVSETVDALVVAFENLSPDKVQALGHWYAPDARFKDPFKEVQGIAAIEAIFVHMFDSLHEPRFVVTERIVQGSQCFLVWDFVFRF
jgi:ketosteroid isomerase-like protein